MLAENPSQPVTCFLKDQYISFVFADGRHVDVALGAVARSSILQGYVNYAAAEGRVEFQLRAEQGPHHLKSWAAVASEGSSIPTDAVRVQECLEVRCLCSV